MKLYTLSLLMLSVPCVALGQSSPASLHVSYATYAASLQVAEVDAGFGLGPYTYQMNLAYRTTGFVGLVNRGHQLSTVSGTWHGADAVPSRYFGEGVWRGQRRVADIDYEHGLPTVRQLVPPNEAERELVPTSKRENAIDTLSALVELIRNVGQTGRCETSVRTFDGRRATEINASTVGEEVLEPTSRSSFVGKALRCDFAGRLLSGFKFGNDHDEDAKTMHGSAWLAAAIPGGPPIPVKMTFETRWFGNATMYLTGVGSGAQLASQTR
jgi:hypothetical protein